ncbi:MAG: hypothetical protein JSS71_00360 [Armatimonadetes bacterium]|nr:hypothetical protein [Armatimonadota bacterium]MBX3110048.1 hypothetical protein [Fimbriimonadaceae bacterium]
MQYFVIWNDGQKFGPADIQVLNEWIAQGRITPATELESVADGSRLQAGSLPGLNFGGGMAAQPQQPVQPQQPMQPMQPMQPAMAPAPSGGDQYFVIGNDGSKYGPADVATLSQWAADNRLSPNSQLENAATGARVVASMVAGIMFPTAASAAASPLSLNQPMGQSQGYSAGPTNYPREFSDPNAGNTEFIISIICSVIGLLCCPCLFSTAGIVLGNMAQKKGHKNGQVAMIIGIVSLVLGFVIGAAVNMNNPAFQELMRGGR